MLNYNIYKCPRSKFHVIKEQYISEGVELKKYNNNGKISRNFLTQEELNIEQFDEEENEYSNLINKMIEEIDEKKPEKKSPIEEDPFLLNKHRKEIKKEREKKISENIYRTGSIS